MASRSAAQVLQARLEIDHGHVRGRRDEAPQHATHGGVCSAQSPGASVIGLAHHEEGEVLGDGLPEPSYEVFGRHLQLEACPSLSIRLLLEPVPGDGGQGGRLAVRQPEGHREIRVAVIVEGDDLLATLRQNPRERAGDGGLAGAALSPDRDLHRGSGSYRNEGTVANTTERWRTRALERA